MPASVLIVDDHYIVRSGLEIVVRETIGKDINIDFAKDGDDVIDRIKKKKYTLCICDINMPGTDTLQVVKQILVMQPLLKILILSVNPKEVFASFYMKCGVYGYIYKGDIGKELREALKCIYAGEKYLSNIKTIENEASNPFAILSEREFVVMHMLLRGHGLQETADILHLSKSATNTYKNRIFQKLNIGSVIELSALAKTFNVVNNDSSLY